MRIMNRHIFQNILFLLLAIGCTKEPIKTIQNTLIIQGENVVRFNTSRNTLNEGLPAGSTLTFYSQGAFMPTNSHFPTTAATGKERIFRNGRIPNNQQSVVLSALPCTGITSPFTRMVSYATSSMPKPPQTTEKTFIYLFSTCLHVSYLMYPAN